MGIIQLLYNFLTFSRLLGSSDLTACKLNPSSLLTVILTDNNLNSNLYRSIILSQRNYNFLSLMLNVDSLEVIKMLSMLWQFEMTLQLRLVHALVQICKHFLTCKNLILSL